MSAQRGHQDMSVSAAVNSTGAWDLSREELFCSAINVNICAAVRSFRTTCRKGCFSSSLFSGGYEVMSLHPSMVACLSQLRLAALVPGFEGSWL